MTIDMTPSRGIIFFVTAIGTVIGMMMGLGHPALADDSGLPVMVFTDGDPYGYCNIYRTLKSAPGSPRTSTVSSASRRRNSSA